MSKFILSVIALIAISFTACNRSNHIKLYQGKFKSHSIAILPISALNGLDEEAFKDCRQAVLTPNEIALIDNLLRHCIGEYNKPVLNAIKSGDLDETDLIEELDNYTRQYIAAFNQSGEKMVWVNCIKEYLPKHWKKVIIEFDDGGTSVFTVKINLNRRECYELWPNGKS